ncbi:MAG: type II toxin-antitoxin system RelE family toxin [Hyphomicrobiales bacterium]
MPKLDGLEAVLEYLTGLQPKISAQIAKKAMSLAVEPLPADNRQLDGYPEYRRVDAGEHRIVYRFHEQDDVVEVVLIGKRNDDWVYRALRRKLR